MHNSEFVKKVVPLLEDFEYRQVISKSISRGFIIPGFSNNKRNVKVSIPISLVVSTGVLNKKVNKEKYNYCFYYCGVTINIFTYRFCIRKGFCLFRRNWYCISFSNDFCLYRYGLYVIYKVF